MALKKYTYIRAWKKDADGNCKEEVILKLPQSVVFKMKELALQANEQED